MMLPEDYVNYVKLTSSDSAGIEHILYPAIKTSNPTPQQEFVYSDTVVPSGYSFDTSQADRSVFIPHDFTNTFKGSFTISLWAKARNGHNPGRQSFIGSQEYILTNSDIFNCYIRS